MFITDATNGNAINAPRVIKSPWATCAKFTIAYNKVIPIAPNAKILPSNIPWTYRSCTPNMNDIDMLITNPIMIFINVGMFVNLSLIFILFTS